MDEFEYQFNEVPADLKKRVRNDRMARESIKHMGGSGIRLERHSGGWRNPFEETSEVQEAYRIYILGGNLTPDPIGQHRFQLYVKIDDVWCIR